MRRPEACDRRGDEGRVSRSAAVGLAAGGVVVAALVILIVLAVTPSTSSNTGAGSGTNRGTTGTSGAAHTSTTSGGHSESPSVFAQAVQGITHLSPSVLNSVGVDNHDASRNSGINALNLATGNTANLPQVDGKPVLFFFGAEWCPFCAAERWSLIIVLSRFGTFSGLGPGASSPTDYAPNTQTFTFDKSTYTSPYIAFAPVEYQDSNKRQLQTPNAAEFNVLKAWDAVESFPFVDLAGRYLGGLPYWEDPLSMANQSRTQIAAAVNDPTNTLGATMDANANYLTAGICAVDGDRPATACFSSGVEAAAAQLADLPDAKPISG